MRNAGVGNRTLDNTGMSRALLPLSYTGKIIKEEGERKYSITSVSKQSGKKKMVAGVGFEPTTSGLCIPLQISLLPIISEFVVWTFPSPSA